MRSIDEPRNALIFKPNQFDQVSAVFRPARADDLQPGLEACVGKRYVFEAAWVIESGEYRGQWALKPLVPMSEFPAGWVPECDLAEIEAA